MNNKTISSWGLFLLLLAILLTYGLGTLTAVGSWFGHQNLDPTLWAQASLPYFAFVFGLGFCSTLALLKRKRWGVYGLVITWILTGVLNVNFGPPFPNYTLTVAAAFLIIAFFMLLLPIWPELE